MRVIGGLCDWDTARAVELADVRSMAASIDAAATARCAVEGSLGLFTSPGLVEESTPRIRAVADLELANARELGPSAGAGAETALLASLYAEEGPEFVRRLRGGFALALWDRRERTLLLATDQFGIKRLYYATDARRTAFASRASALGSGRDVDPTAVFTYLNFGYLPAPVSIRAGAHRLPPGALVLVRDGRATERRYWRLAYSERPAGAIESAAALARATEAAVAEGAAGIPPKEVGAFLSGGTDSSTVVGLLARLSGERVNAFSIGFAEAPYDELHYAEVAARHFGAAHYVKVVTAEDALEALPRLVEAYDEPFGNNSAVGTYVCARLARECGVRALLAGDGGDEIFGGNERYTVDRIFARYQLLPRALRHRILEPILAMLPESAPGPLGRAQRYVRRANIPNPHRFFSYQFLFAQRSETLLAPDFRAAVDERAPATIIQAQYDAAEASAELNRLLHLDLRLAIGDNDLLKVTRTAELAGVAVRFPLLSLPLVELTATLPVAFKVKGLEKRVLFKRAFRTLLPREVLAKRKHGFGVPTSLWLRSHSRFSALARETLLSTRARGRGYFQPRAIEGLFEAHAADATPFYGDILWTLLMLELWHRRHADAGAAA